MKKKIVISIFLLLILITAIAFIVGAIVTYNYEVANDDILVGLGAGITLLIGSFVVFYELDLFYIAYYFLIKPKTITKSLLNVVSNLTLLTIFFSDGIAYILYNRLNIFKEDGLLPLFLLFTYCLLRIAYLIVSYVHSAKEFKKSKEN